MQKNVQENCTSKLKYSLRAESYFKFEVHFLAVLYFKIEAHFARQRFLRIVLQNRNTFPNKQLGLHRLISENLLNSNVEAVLESSTSKVKCVFKQATRFRWVDLKEFASNSNRPKKCT